jgi:putative hydrolase of the HAD superfamily
MNIVFDFGAVLFTWQPANLIAQHLSEHAPTAEQAKRLAGDIFHHQDWQDFDRGVVDLDPVVQRTASRLGLPAAQLAAFLSPIGERLLPIASTVALLAQLKTRREAGERLKLYYLSNMPAPFARVLEQRHDFLEWFDGGIFSGDVKLAKPDPAIFQLLQHRYTLEPQRTVFIDDLQANVAAAQALGWHGIHCEDVEVLAAAVHQAF